MASAGCEVYVFDALGVKIIAVFNHIIVEEIVRAYAVPYKMEGYLDKFLLGIPDVETQIRKAPMFQDVDLSSWIDY